MLVDITLEDEVEVLSLESAIIFDSRTILIDTLIVATSLQSEVDECIVLRVHAHHGHG